MHKITRTPYFKLGAAIFAAGALLIVFNRIIAHFAGFSEGISQLESILSPFIYGFVMAYLLCPIYNFSVRKLYKAFSRRAKNKKRAFRFARVLATVIAMVILIGVVAGLTALVIPQVIDSISDLISMLPGRIQALYGFLSDKVAAMQNREVASQIGGYLQNIQERLSGWVSTTVLPRMGDLVSRLSQGLIATLRTIINIAIGLVVCVYVLNSKENFKAQSRKIIIALTKKETAERIFDFGAFTNRTFGGFINGKIIDSIIIGLLCFILMSIFRMPYAILVSTIIGITNVIPFFGPIIGAVPSAIIICVVSPLKALYFLLLIFLLQQVDGNIIGPAVLGKTTRLASFWVMFAIIVGGGLFGFFGMVIGVPVFAIIYYYIARFIDGRLRKKDMPEATADYRDYQNYDIERGEVE